MSQSLPQQTPVAFPPPTQTATPPQSTPPTPTLSTISIPTNAPAGNIVMTQPPIIATSFYKIAPGQVVTFGWKYTQVLRQPDRLTVNAVCKENGNTYPVGPTDGILPGTATQVLWDLNAWQTNNPQQPLGQGTYVLSIFDERGEDALARPGFLKQFNDLQFGLYTPQPYTPLADGWTCPQCFSGVVMLTATHPAFVGIAISFLVIFLSGFRMLR